jgi:hypothetical protein
MLSRRPSPERFLQFVRHIGADENTLSICHIFMSISRGKIAWAPLAVGSARKPNFVSAVRRMAIIHLGRPLPNGSSGLPENVVGLHRTRNRAGSFSFPYLALHREEFTWPRVLPPAPVSSYLTVSPITSRKRLVCSLLHLSSPAIHGRPDVIRLAALWCSDFPLPLREATARTSNCLAKRL